MAYKLLNDPRTLVTESLEGLVEAIPHLRRLHGYPDIKVVFDGEHDKSKVAIISGGGSGHEPAHAGYVGTGMLTAAVAGEVFASPSAEAVLAAILTVTGPAGCLLVVKNYTGDRLNFGLAAEQAKAAGLAVEMVVVQDDCAIVTPGLAGRRGLAGTVLVHKVAGAAAAEGAPLSEVTSLAAAVSHGLGTMGVALSVCTLPGQAPSSRLPLGQLELGLGIHGEPGVQQLPWAPIHNLLPIMLRHIVEYPQQQPGTVAQQATTTTSSSSSSSSSSSLFPPGSPVVLLVNNLGATTPLELQLVAKEALAGATGTYQLKVHQLYSGPFMTSLDMAGASITLLQLAAPGSDSPPAQRLLELLAAPTSAPHWPKGDTSVVQKAPVPLPPQVVSLRALGEVTTPQGELDAAAKHLQECLTGVANTLISAVSQLNALDSKIGDGDCGTTMAAGATALLELLQQRRVHVHDPAAAMRQVAAVAQQSMGGTSGGLYGAALTAAAASLSASTSSSGGQPLGLKQWAAAFQAGVAAVQKYGGVGVGGRTMVDALLPAAEALSKAAAEGLPAKEAAAVAAAAATAGAQHTAQLEAAQAGRASYVPAAALHGTPDPGAEAVSLWMASVAQQIR